MKKNWIKSIVSFLFGVIYNAVGTRADADNGKDDGPSYGALLSIFFGIGWFADRCCRGFCQRRYTPDPFRVYWRSAFWTGWVEFLFQYYAVRWGTQPEMENGEIVTRPEYLILPATFGLWMMVMTLYIFSTRNGCNFINWWQKILFRGRKPEIVARPMTRHASIVTFVELMMILWASYFVADVLLRQEFHRRYPSDNVDCCRCLFFRFNIYFQEAVEIVIMGEQISECR